MGNVQASQQRGALAQFYASNGANVDEKLFRMAGAENVVVRLADMFGVTADQMNMAQAATAASGDGAEAGTGVSGGTVGGASYVGGFSDMQNYGNSVYSKAKEQLIRNIAEDVFTALKAKGIKNVRNAPIADVVKHLTNALPPSVRNPHKFNSSFNKSSSSQRSVCLALANAINKHYAGALIDLDGDENVMCGKIAEIMYSLLTGLHTEFMNVAGDVLRVMNNMQLAEEYLERAYKKQREIIESSSDERLRDMSAQTDKVYEEVKAEYNRQNALLANLINISVGPTGKSLINSLEDNKDFVGTVKNLKAMVGTDAFGDKLAYLLSGISSVAHSAELIDKALKVIGMSASDFRNAKNATELRSKVFKHIASQSPSSAKLDAMMKAARIIYEANYDHDAISKALGAKGGDEAAMSMPSLDGENKEGSDSDDGSSSSDEEMVDELDENGKPTGRKVRKHRVDNLEAEDAGPLPADGSMPTATGGADDDEGLSNYWRRKSLKKKIDNKKVYRDLVLKEFRKELKMQLRQIVEAANEISHSIGNGIPVTDDLRHFVDLFETIPTLDSENLHLALSGYPRDSTSKEQREVFMLKFDAVLRAAEPLLKGPQGQSFRGVVSAIQAMVRTIDNFSDKMVKALTEIHIDRPEEVAAAVKKTAATFYGAGESAGDEVFGEGSWIAFDKVKAEMKYYLSIANIKSNLARSHEDLQSYAEDYEQLLGEESAWIIDRIKKQYVDRIDNLEVAALPAGLPAGTVNVLQAVQAAINGLATEEAKKQSRDNFRSLWTFQMNAKVNMVKVAQAIDMYLKAFTDGISKHPDAISSVVKMLNSVEIVAKWFNDRSGDQLASLFDVFPNSYNGAVPGYLESKDSVVTGDGVVRIPNGDNHYYAYLESRWLADGVAAAPDDGKTSATDHHNLPGNPFLGRSLLSDHTTSKQCAGIITLSQKVVKSMRALENILSAFASVGSKFGDLEPLSKTFMTPGQIFNALCDYVAASAFTTEFAPKDAALTAAAYNSKTKLQRLDDAGFAGAAGLPNTSYIPTSANRVRYRVAGLTRSQSLARQASSALVGAPAAIDRDGGAEYGILTGVANNAGAAAGRKYTTVALSGLPGVADGEETSWTYHNAADAGTENPDRMRVDLAGWRDNFFDTDQLFQMVIKSIVAKIFTVVDAYRLFNRPVSDRRAHYSLNPLRSILGGSADADGGALTTKVKVIPEALELYHRLLLLAEWYRENFGLQASDAGVAHAPGVAHPVPAAPGAPNDSWRITVVPAIDGIWSDLVNVVFDRAEHVKEGNYSETQVQRIILAINAIWNAYKSKYPKTTTRGVLNAFVLEMNRAFGFLRQSDIKSYLEDRRKNLNENPDYKSTEGEFLDFDILNANDQFGSRPAPSDRFTTVGTSPVPAKRAINMMFLQQAIESLRKKIDVDFLAETQAAEANQPAFAESLKNYRIELANAKSDMDEYKVVLRMLQGANKYIQVNADKMIMVHEAVAAPLTTLYAVYKVMARFNALCHGCSLENLEAWSASRAAAGGVGRGALDNAANARNEYAAFLESKYTKILGANRATSIPVRLFTRALVGTGAAGLPQGYLLRQVAADVAIPSADLDSAHLIKDMLAALLDFGTNPSRLVTVAVGQSGALNIDYAALEDLCRDLLAQVKENLKKLRANFNVADMKLIVDKYEDAANVGSTRWLEENMFQQLFADRDEAGLSRGIMHFRKSFESVCNVDPAAGAVYGALDNAVRGLIFYENIPNSLPRRYCQLDLTKFPGNVISLLKLPETQPEKDAVSQTGRVALGDNNIRAALNSIHPAPVVLYESPDSINTFDLDGNASAAKSLMQTFNKLLHMYLYLAMEDGANKFYAPLIESFATSAASLEVMQGKAFPNIAKAADNSVLNEAGNGNHGAAVNAVLQGPPEATVVYGSNAVIIRSLLQSVQAIGLAQKKRFLFETLAEVPEYLKDRLRVNLPYFSKLFDAVAQRATLLKQLLDMTNLRRHIASPAGADVVAPINDRLPAGVVSLIPINGRNAATQHKYYDALLTRLIECGHSMRKCADGVYRELQDHPLAFFETSKDFLADFRSRNGGSPFMPYSSILTPLVCLEGNPAAWNSTDASHLLLPVRENGSNVFKFNSAARLLLGRSDVEPQVEHFPGAKDIYNAYAASANKSSVISPAEFANTLKHTVRIGRFLMDGLTTTRLFGEPARNLRVDANSYTSRSVFQAVNWSDGYTQIADLNPVREVRQAGPAGALSAGVLDLARLELGAANVAGAAGMDAVAAAAAAAPSGWRVNGRLSILPLVDSTGITGIVELTENTNLSVSKSRISQIVDREVDAVNNIPRNRMRVLNILDAGIVPLNVHAFMREVPFVNLLNYSYTFDRMIHDFVLPTYLNDTMRAGGITVANLIMPPNAAVTSTRQLLVKLLVHPYADLGINGQQYFGLLASLFNGNDDLRLGRPRYLSDQLWHKALLTSSPQLVAGQPNYPTMTVASRYPADVRSLEAGPSAYEAMRASVRHLANAAGERRLITADATPNPAMALESASLPVATPGLKYLDANGKWRTAQTAGPSQNVMSSGDVLYCAELGRMRFDTKLVRNLTWFINLQRIMRVVLTSHLSWLNTPVVRGLKIADSTVTEYEGNEKFDDKDFTGEKYSLM